MVVLRPVGGLQLKNAAPVAVKVTGSPLQRLVLGALMETLGMLPTVTVTVVESTQAAVVPITV
jgi:hypothetical protein